uniref:Mediator of RNA polymerase II transcription subunit 8 n=1 Tax=Angiostrongylus cantonensis TaxID=6313 RepID=A0A0K0D887_ANGCA
MDDVEAELINELEFQYYGFSPFGFVDTAVLMEDKQGYLAEVTKMFFHSKGIKEATDILTERILKYVLRIPRHVTLPEHEHTHQLLFSDEPDVQELNRQNSKLAKCIVEERIQEANDAAEVLTTLIEQLERASLDVTDDSVGDSDVNTPS